MSANGRPDSELVVSIESFPSGHPENDGPMHEVVVAGDGGDYSWAAYMDPDIARIEQSRLVTMLTICLPPGAVTVSSITPDVRPEDE